MYFVYSVLYRNVGPKKLWDVDEWLEDVLRYIDTSSKTNASKTILMGFSGGCQTVLRATVMRPNDICGLFLLAPGVGLNLQSFVAEAMPELAKELFAGNSVIYPAAKDGFPALVNAECLKKYSEVCMEYSEVLYVESSYFCNRLTYAENPNSRCVFAFIRKCSAACKQ